MRFILLLCGGADAAERAADPTMPERCDQWRAELERRGIRVASTGLQPPDSALTLRMNTGDLIVSDGPFAETKEQIGGFSLIDCADHETAVNAAAQHPWAAAGVIEVRPLAPATRDAPLNRPGATRCGLS